MKSLPFNYPAVFMSLGYVLGLGSGILIGSSGRWGQVAASNQSIDCNSLAALERRNWTTRDDAIGKSVWEVLPLEHTKHVDVFANQAPTTTDAYNPFFQYMNEFTATLTSKGQYEPEKVKQDIDFPDLPLWDSWIHYFECYHNHFYRFRGKKVTLMEIGVQSGGKIALFRDYFGPGLTYVGVDINNSTRKFGSADWVNIEIGNSQNREFLASLRKKYPHVDIFLDDGGHTMPQQMIALEEMLPHVHPEGVYMCEDLGTSWLKGNWQGIPNGDLRSPDFLEKTMVGLVIQTMMWLNMGWLAGIAYNWVELPAEHYPNRKWWKAIPKQVKHIHWYNQAVVYEKGLTYKGTRVRTTGTFIPYENSGVHEPVDWDPIMKKIQNHTKSPWKW